MKIYGGSISTQKGDGVEFCLLAGSRRKFYSISLLRNSCDYHNTQPVSLNFIAYMPMAKLSLCLIICKTWFVVSILLRGWTNYHKHIVSKEVFKEIDFYLWRMLGRWCNRRHPNKSWKWIRNKYFSASDELCSFASVTLSKNGKFLKIHKIYRAGKVKIIRHRTIKSSQNPFIKEHEEYFVDRRRVLRYKSGKSKQSCRSRIELNEFNKNLLNLWKCKAGDHSKKVA